MKFLDLSLIKIDQLPATAALYRGWRNSFVTKCCSIGQTGEDIILQWIQKAFDYSANGVELLNSGLLPRLDAHIASILAEKTEYILNSIPADHQPSEHTKFTWLFQRLERCKSMARHIDKIRDSSEASHRRTFEWLFGKLTATLYEPREDTNEEAIRRLLHLNEGKGKGKDKVKPKAATAVQKDETPTALPVNPKSKAPPKGDKDSPKGSKGKGKGDKPAKGGNPPVPPKARADGPPPKANPKDNRDKSTVPCLFFPTGTCNSGESCPFSHDGAAAKAKPKAAAKGPATAKAPVATLIITGASQGANAIKTNTSFVAETHFDCR